MYSRYQPCWQVIGTIITRGYMTTWRLCSHPPTPVVFRSLFFSFSSHISVFFAWFSSKEPAHRIAKFTHVVVCASPKCIVMILRSLQSTIGHISVAFRIWFEIATFLVFFFFSASNFFYLYYWKKVIPAPMRTSLHDSHHLPCSRSIITPCVWFAYHDK